MKKIVIPTDREVEQYTGGAKPSPDAANSGGGPTGGKPAGISTESEAAAVGEASSSSGSQVSLAEQPRSEAEEYKDKYLRAVAELSNFRKRSEKDREESLRYANAALVRSLLNVLDNLDRVVASAQEHPENSAAIVDGVKLTAESFRKVLRDHNVAAIEAEGQSFDPVVHEAMMQQPSDQHDAMTVLKVVQDGYKLYDRVIRPARVIVAAPKSVE